MAVQNVGLLQRGGRDRVHDVGTPRRDVLSERRRCERLDVRVDPYVLPSSLLIDSLDVVG